MSDCFFEGESKNELQNESASAGCDSVFPADWLWEGSSSPSSFAGVDQREVVQEPREGVVPVGGAASGPLIPSSTCIPAMNTFNAPLTVCTMYNQ